MTASDNLYGNHFGLCRPPFELAPDPEFLFLSRMHSRARAYLNYTVLDRNSFVVITGEIGSGKTTLIHDLLANMGPGVIVARIHQTQLNELEFYQSILLQFGLKPGQAAKVELLEMLNSYLMDRHKRGHQVVLIIDEAQNLSRKILEEVRLMTGLETDKGKIFNLVLVGQPELKEIIESSGMEQLNQRIRLRFHLGALSRGETREYINHRLHIAGHAGPGLFSRTTYSMIHQYTGGIPRLINILCDMALLSSFLDKKPRVTLKTIENAIMELQWRPYCDRKHMQPDAEGLLQFDKPLPRLVVKRMDRNTTEEVCIDKPEFTLGRMRGNDIRLTAGLISPHHAKIIAMHGKYYILDMESKHGTYVNNQRIRRCRIKSGDRITLSPGKLLLEDGTTIIHAPAVLEFVHEGRSGTDEQVVSIAAKR